MTNDTSVPKTTASLVDVKKFFNLSATEMTNEWTKGGLTAEDKAQIRDGIFNGTYNY